MPGKEAMTYVAGVLAATILFKKTYTMIGVFILAVGDPIARITGEILGRTEIPWNREKHVEGRIISAVICGATLMFVYKNSIMFIPPSLAMLIETVPLNKFGIGDNFLITITAAAASSLTKIIKII